MIDVENSPVTTTPLPNVTPWWLEDLMQDLWWTSRRPAYFALRAVLHALRGRLPPQAAVRLSAELPPPMCGLFLEGWPVGGEGHPAARPAGTFLDELVTRFEESLPWPEETRPEWVAQAVFRLLERTMRPAALDQLGASLPAEVARLWRRHAPSAQRR